MALPGDPSFVDLAIRLVSAALAFSTFFMKTMLPMRLVGIASNVAFMAYALLGLAYGDFGRLYPIFVLHACLLPLNVLRLQARLTAGQASFPPTVRALDFGMPERNAMPVHYANHCPHGGQDRSQ